MPCKITLSIPDQPGTVLVQGGDLFGRGGQRIGDEPRAKREAVWSPETAERVVDLLRNAGDFGVAGIPVEVREEGDPSLVYINRAFVVLVQDVAEHPDAEATG
jgi:hypothetical protein